MARNAINLRYEHKELLKDITNVAISYTPVSGMIDTLRFLDKWLLRRRKIHRFVGGIARKYRMFRLRMTAWKRHSWFVQKLNILRRIRRW